ncbi:MAG: TonB family protein [Gemmatimonadaceae bacterium]|nr:TonB family protein [Chitinophagaceae bacterium]
MNKKDISSKILLIFFACILCLCVKAQRSKSDEFRYFNKNMEPMKTAKLSAFFTRIRKNADTSFQFATYKYNSHCLYFKTTLDAEGKIRHGLYGSFHAGGIVDSTGMFHRDKQVGTWQYYDKTGNLLREVEYLNGMALSDDDTTRSVFSDVHQPADLIGKEGSWDKFLVKNLRYPENLFESRISGTVVVRFAVAENGKTHQIGLLKSAHYDLDEESLRLVMLSGDWEPGIRNGLKVNSYLLKPIAFNFVN